jgi:GcrA cell cycle regulator
MSKNQFDSGWTEEKIARLTTLWNEGVPVLKLGLLIGVSKNAVVGKASRLGLTPRENLIKAQGTGHKPRAARVKKPGVPALAPLPSLAKTAERAVIAQAKAPPIKPTVFYRSEPCCWPMKTPCGERAVRGKPYCAAHCDVAYIGAPVSKNTGFDWTRPDKFRIAR